MRSWVAPNGRGIAASVDRALSRRRSLRSTERRMQEGYDFALWLPKIASGLAQLPRWATLMAGMIDLLKLLGGLLVGVFRSHAAYSRSAESVPAGRLPGRARMRSS